MDRRRARTRGGRELDGLAWQLPLDRLWENYVEGIIRREAAQTGGEVKVGRLGQTTIPLHWSDPVHRSLGHLLPDIVVVHASTAGWAPVPGAPAVSAAHWYGDPSGLPTGRRTTGWGATAGISSTADWYITESKGRRRRHRLDCPKPL